MKVTDFGICRIDGGDHELTQHTQLGDVLGTPNYMSPEQVLGQKVDSRSDLFSVGVVLYKLVTGALPFEGDSIISVAMKITQTDPPTVEKLRPDVPLSLRRVIERALKKAAREALPDRRGVRAGADRRGARAEGARRTRRARARGSRCRFAGPGSWPRSSR